MCRERGLSAIINIHDVSLAVRFADRIVGLRRGTIVYDGLPQGLSESALTNIYGEEDWGATAQGSHGQASDGDERVSSAVSLPVSDMSGVAA